MGLDLVFLETPSDALIDRTSSRINRKVRHTLVAFAPDGLDVLDDWHRVDLTGSSSVAG